MFSLRKNILFSLDKFLSGKRLPFYGGYSKWDCFIDKNLVTYLAYPVQIRFLITSVSTKNLHTIKGWKSLARDGQKEEVLPSKSPVSCEEGAGAFPHLDLMKQLQDCNTVSDQMKTFSSLLSLTSKDIENRKEFCKSLEKIFSPYFSEFKIHLFGSSINSLGFKGCDADISIQTIFNGNKEYSKDITQVPTLDSVIQGETSTDTIALLPSRFLLRFVRRILRRHCPDVKEPILLIKAKCSLLRFYNRKYDLFCDFSCENMTSLRNTKLVRLLSHLDERFIYLAKFIRYWGKYGGFVGDIDMFNSYSFSLLVVHFLQLRDPPILPPIQELKEKSEYLEHGHVNDDYLLLKDVKKFQQSKNTETLEELLRGFFFYYLTFDFSHVMVPLNSTIVPKADFVIKKDDGSLDIFEFSTITVQDPFRPNYNVTMAANFKSCKRFLNAIVEACSTYQDKSIWQPGVDKWGICSLFHRTVYESEMHKKWQENCVHTIKLPLQVHMVKEILMECLLFDCRELRIPQDDESLLLRLSCKAYSNTWQGRHLIYKSYPQSWTNHMEIENWVSKKLLKKKESDRRLLFTFLCECFDNKHDKELNVVLTFKECKYPPVVAIFLKEYLSSMCKKVKN